MVCDLCLLYQIDSVAEEVERQKSKSDMVLYAAWEVIFVNFLMINDDVAYLPVLLIVGIYIWRCRSTAFRCYHSRHCKSFWCSFGALHPAIALFLNLKLL